MSDAKTKFDYEVEAFETAFGDKKELRIAIYGTGRMTATLLERIKGFCIIGLLDRDSSMVGKEMYGTRILSREEAEKNADIIVINTSEAYWGTIYKRIQDWEIPVYFRNGVRASQEFLHESEDNPYWQKNSTELEEKMEQYEVISFDIFDTLIMRKVYLPTDIFNIVERRLQSELGEDFSFVEIRKKAASICDNATIDEIYSEIEKIQNWDCELTKKVKQCEIDIEKQFIVPRRDMVRLYNSIKNTKEVYFISDMYLPKQILEEILLQCGIRIAKEKIIVSCDYKKAKEGGLLWKYYADTIVKGRKALHIGDNRKTDSELPERYGIDSYIIWSAAQMLQESSIRDIIADVNTLYSSLVVGMISVKLLNSPFALQKTYGKIYFNDECEAGFCLLGCLMYVFCNWLIQRTKNSRVGKLAFFSREGYLLTQIFKYYCEISEEKDTPKIEYMEISRRVVLTASICDEEDMLKVAEFPYIGNMKNFLKDRFGIWKEDLKPCEQFVVETGGNKQQLQEILKQIKSDILLEADREKKNYLAYLDSIGLISGFAIVDSQLHGTTQYYLGKMLGEKLKGYYFCVCKDKTNRYLERNNMEGCFPGKMDLDGKDSNIYKNATFIEAFFTSPEGMLECVEDDGSKRYAEKKQNQLNFNIRFEMLKGIQDFLKEIIFLCKEYGVAVTSEDRYFTDNMLGVFMNSGFEPTEKMKDSFFYDNGILGNKEVPIWE